MKTIEIRIKNTGVKLDVSNIELTPENIDEIFKRFSLAYKRMYNEIQ